MLPALRYRFTERQQHATQATSVDLPELHLFLDCDELRALRGRDP